MNVIITYFIKFKKLLTLRSVITFCASKERKTLMNHDSPFACKMHSDFRDVHMWEKMGNTVFHFSFLHPGPAATRALGSSWRGPLALPPRTRAHGAPSHFCALLPPPHPSPASLLCFIRSYISQHFPEKAWV